MKKYISTGLIVLSMIVAGPLSVLAMQHHVPVVETYGASNITSTTAVLNGWVRGNLSGSGHVWFEVGLGNYWQTGPLGIHFIDGDTATTFSQKLTNLQPHTTYYYFVRAENTIGKNTGQTMTFTTK